jgi:uncharacterized pyridoxamine 5'-phosphate oxidase family protein
MKKEEVIDLVKDAGFGFLATVEDKQPRVRPMMPYLTDDNKLLLSLLSRSRTIPQVEQNPQVEFCFVDRKMWYCRLTGKAKLSDNLEDKTTVFNNVPMLRQYFGSPEDPNYKLIEIEIIDVEAMMPHQKEPEKIDLS